MRDESQKGDSMEEAAKIKMWLKRGTIKILDLELRYKFNIRNKQGGVYPSHIMCDYSFKRYK